MNRIYRLVWNRASNAWVAVAETACSRGKARRHGRAALVTLLLAPLGAWASPSGGQVQSGIGSILQAGTTTTIVQSSPTLGLSWRSFDLAANQTVNFVQPSAAAVAVNRIFDPRGSQILGRISANGQVYLINPNGILFGPGAQVDVGGLVASTLDLQGAADGPTRRFAGDGSGSIVNQGRISAAPGGSVALLGRQVSNEGSISARLGTVALGAGSALTLSFDGSGRNLLQMQVDTSLVNSLARNGGLLQADGGQVLMSAGARDALLASVVNNTGVIEAHRVEEHGGRITLLGGMQAGRVELGGTLDAGAPDGGAGGQIETSAAQVRVLPGARVSTAAALGVAGSWLIDPVDFIIAAGSGAQTGSGIGADTLAAALGAGNVSIATGSGTGGNGDIFVNAAVAWAANKLTLSASRNIAVNAALSATGTGSLAFEYGQAAVAAGNTATYTIAAPVTLPAGATFSTKLGSDGSTRNFTVITALGAAGSTTGTDLQGMNGALAGNYALGADIAAAATSGWNSGAGFAPVGNSSGSPFSGTFDGLGHTINGLVISRSGTSYQALFGYANASASIRNVGLAGGSVTGNSYTGSLVGYLNGGSVRNSGSSATVAGNGASGGLIGRVMSGAIVSDSHASGNVSGNGWSLGGLVGYGNGTLTNDYATGNVTSGSGGGVVGGLLGTNRGTVSNSYASGNVGGGGYGGGLVGRNLGTINNSWASGSVSGSWYTGGLVGTNYGSITNSYATGSTSGGSQSLGGLIGGNYGTVSGSYWNSDVRAIGIGHGSGSGAAGLSSAQMLVQSNFSGWDFSGTWAIYDTHSQPLLRGLLTPLTVTANDASRTYDGNAYSGGNGVSYSVTPGGALLGTVSYGGTAQGAVNTGSYTLVPSGLYSTSQFGYLIGYANGTLTINPALLSISLTGSRAYDGSTNVAASIFTLSGMRNGENLTLTGVGTVADPNVGNNKTVTLGTLTLGDGVGGLASNYTFSGGTQTASITRAPLTVTANSTSRSYGQANPGFTTTVTGFVNGETAATAAGYGGSGSATSTATTTTNAGTAVITAGAGTLTATNYAFSNLVDGTLTINKAHLTVTADNANRTYGQANPSLTTTVSGFVNGETAGTAAGYGGSGSATSTATPSTNVGAAVISAGAGTLTATNYDFTNLVDGTLTINRAHLTVTANDASRTYGQANPSLTTTVSGFVNGETALTAAGYGGSGSATSTATPTTNAGTATITAGAGTLTATNYDFSNLVNGTLTIDKAHLTVTADNANRIYGQANPSLTTTVSGFVNGETAGTAAGYGGSGSATSAATPTTNVGTATITAGAGSLTATNYDFSNLVNGTLTINKAALTVTANDASRTYGQSNPGFTTTVTGFVNGETAATAAGYAGSGSATSTATPTTNSGTATIAAGAGSLTATNYDFSNLVNGTLTINKAVLTVTADNASRTYGQANPGFATTVTGFVNGETAATAAGYAGSGSASSTATPTTNAGTATITAGAGTLTATNYDFSNLVNGTLTINKAALTVTANDSIRTYGQANPSFDTTVTGFVNGETALTAAGYAGSGSATSIATQTTNAGTAMITAGAGSLTATNYTFSQLVNGTLTIDKAALTVTANPASKTYGQANPGFTTMVTGFVNGESAATAAGYAGSASATSTATPTTHAGTATISAGAGSLTATNYTVGHLVDGTLTIDRAPLTATVSAPNKVYDGTTVAAPTITITSGLVGNETLSVSGQASFNSKDVATANRVTVDSLTLADGSGRATDYTLAAGQSTAASIAPAPLTARVTVADKVYDGSTVATPTLTITAGLVGSETVGASGSAHFDSKAAGSAKTARVDSVTLADGSGAAANYSLAAGQTTTAAITPRPLTVSGLAVADKVYDGSTVATVSTSGAQFSGLLNGDQVRLDASGAFVDRNAGSAKTVLLSNVFSGADAGNYAITAPSSAQASIGPATLSYVATPSRALAGQPLPVLTGSLSGFVGGDTQADATSGGLAWTSLAGPASQPGSYAIEGSGLAARNYTLVQASGNAGALTLLPGIAPPSVIHTVNELLTLTAPVPVSAPPTPAPTARGVVDSVIGLGRPGSTLQFMDGGIRLPPVLVNPQ